MRTKLLECYCIHSKRFLGAIMSCFRGQINFKGYLVTTPFIIICGEEWKAQFIKKILTFSLNWKHPSQIQSGTLFRLNCRVSLHSRRVDAGLQARKGPLPTSLQLQYEKCICINVHELSEHVHHLEQMYKDFWPFLYVALDKDGKISFITHFPEDGTSPKETKPMWVEVENKGKKKKKTLEKNGISYEICWLVYYLHTYLFTAMVRKV